MTGVIEINPKLTVEDLLQQRSYTNTCKKITSENFLKPTEVKIFRKEWRLFDIKKVMTTGRARGMVLAENWIPADIFDLLTFGAIDDLTLSPGIVAGLGTNFKDFSSQLNDRLYPALLFYDDERGVVANLLNSYNELDTCDKVLGVREVNS